MKRIAVLAFILFGLLSMHALHASELLPASYPKKGKGQRETVPNVDIRVASTGWGNVRAEDIAILLNAVAGELLSHFPGRKIDPILVSPGSNGPVVLYQRGPNNAYQVKLAARNERWAEYVYEFSHELFHILSNYQYHAPPRVSRNQWFEEMLCETASLYTLKKFSLRWDQSPPRPEWASYAPVLRRFTARALGEPHRRLPAGASFAQWFRHNAAALAGSPYLREKNELVAHLFLPLLEKHSNWQAISYLNREAPGQEAGFHHYLAAWYRNTPLVHRELVRSALTVFDFDEPEADNLLVAADSTETEPRDAELFATGAAGRPGN